jgi:muconate cycloisomerase
MLARQEVAFWNAASPALEMALCDWAGKRLGCRVVDLLGGAYHERVPVDYWFGRQTPEHLKEIVSRAVQSGFHGLKLKSQIDDPIIEQVRAIREAGGERFSITIDPMFQWFSPHDALGILRELEQFGSGIKIEDPFPQDRPELWHRARQATTIPLIWHARDLTSLRRALEERCADDFNLGGGPSIGEFLTFAHAIEVVGYSCWHGTSLGLGVSQAAALHATAAARSCVYASDLQSALLREHTLVDWDWPYQNGTLPLPTGAGLGIELDYQALERFKQAEIECS